MKGSHFKKGESRKNVIPLFQHIDQGRDTCWPELLLFLHFVSTTFLAASKVATASRQACDRRFRFDLNGT
jgi:hypothetical protein